jgi:hypothetical protein
MEIFDKRIYSFTKLPFQFYYCFVEVKINCEFIRARYRGSNEHGEDHEG